MEIKKDGDIERLRYRKIEGTKDREKREIVRETSQH